MQHRRAQSRLWYSHTNPPFSSVTDNAIIGIEQVFGGRIMEITRDTLKRMSTEQLRLIADFVKAALDSQGALPDCRCLTETPQTECS